MKLTINTATLQEMVAKAIKGASNNKLIPLTSLMAIEVKDNLLTLITSDATNYLYATEKLENAEDFYVVVKVDQFSKLISRLTCDEVVLTMTENALLVKGNGDYMIDIPTDENGEHIVYPNPMADVKIKKNTKLDKLNITTIKTILNSCKPALAVTMELPAYTKYFVGDSVVATNREVITAYNVKLFSGEPVLISAELMNLLDVMTEENVEVLLENDIVVFNSPNCVIYGRVDTDVSDFNVEAINQFTTQSFPHSCKFSKTKMLSILDRLALFVSTYDKNAIRMTFTDDGINVESLKSNGIEHIDYIEPNKNASYSLQIDIEMFMTQLKAYVSDAVTMEYGLDSSIKLVDGDIVQVIALSNE